MVGGRAWAHCRRGAAQDGRPSAQGRPEADDPMRPAPWLLIEPYRQQPGGGFDSNYGDRFGFFLIRWRGLVFKTIATDGDFQAAGLPPSYAWEHVSVSLPNRPPSWCEMDHIKDLFWLE